MVLCIQGPKLNNSITVYHEISDISHTWLNNPGMFWFKIRSKTEIILHPLVCSNVEYANTEDFGRDSHHASKK